MLLLLFPILFIGLPLASIVFFGNRLCRYLRAKKRCQADPDACDTARMDTLKKQLTVATILMAVAVAVAIGFVVLLGTAIAYM